MFRTSVFTSMFLTAAVGIAALGSGVASASAAPSRIFVDRIEHALPHVHVITSPQKSYLHPPSKKKPL